MSARHMSRSEMQASAASGALTPEAEAAAPFRLPPAAGAVGDSASAAALARIDAAIREINAAKILPLLGKAADALRGEDHKAAADWAIKALQQDERSGLAWHLLAIAREKAGDFRTSLQCYESALQLLPDEAEIANDLGRLAYRLDMKDAAAKLFLHYLDRYPGSEEAANNLACVLRDDNRYDDAVAVLRPVIQASPAQPLLWNTLGTVLAEQGDPSSAITFFDEALRLDPHFAKARYNRGNARLPLGQYDEALVDCEAAMAEPLAPDEASMMRLARSTILLCLGRIGEGWDAYEERLVPEFHDVTHFMIDRPKWTPESELSGRSLLLMGEQGLGDEVLFASTVPDVLEALGPQGRLAIAVEKRLVGLFQRSFPQAEIGAHATYKVDAHTIRGAPFVKDFEAIDLWAPLASPLRRFRRSVEAYPDRPSFLKADPERVAHWRGELAALGPAPKVGILWKSLKLTGARRRYFSPFEHWEPVLRTPGVRLVNLQYGDCEAEIAEARTRFGVDIWTPPGVDLKNDLDEVAALSCAVDLVTGFANATTNIAAACGAETWLISPPGVWPKLGTDRYPWYPQARVFNPEEQAWRPTMEAIAAALTERFAL